jgi:hypothetical protein
MKLTRTQAQDKLAGARRRVAALRRSTVTSPLFLHWQREVVLLLRKVYGDNSTRETEFRGLAFGMLFDPRQPEANLSGREAYQAHLTRAEQLLAATEAELAAPPGPGQAPAVGLADEPDSEPRAVLVLHRAGSRLLTRLVGTVAEAGLDAAPLAVFPSAGETLEAKLAPYPRARAAVLLLDQADLPHLELHEGDPLQRTVRDVLEYAKTRYGQERVRVVVGHEPSFPRSAFGVWTCVVDPLGQWRELLRGKL